MIKRRHPLGASRLLSGLLVCFAATGAAHADDNELRQKIVGIWGIGPGNGEASDPKCLKYSFEYRADGTFIFTDKSDNKALAGVYAIVDGRITISPLGQPGATFPISFDGDVYRSTRENGAPASYTRCPA
jgi:hypothetical protein